MALGTALFDKPAFNNLTVNGLVLASNPQQMSKRLQNCPDLNIVINKYVIHQLAGGTGGEPQVSGERDAGCGEGGLLDVLKCVPLVCPVHGAVGGQQRR